jgi:hypothetical protein
VGPFTVSLALPAGAVVKRVRLLEADIDVQPRREGSRLLVQVPSVEAHEVIAIDFA